MTQAGWTLNGIDEAGYGPRLGPLVQACVGLQWTAPAPTPFDDWEAVAAGIEVASRTLIAAAERVGVALGDSKQLYARARRSGVAAAGAGAATAAVDGVDGSAAGARVLWEAVRALGRPSVGGDWPDWMGIEQEQHPTEEHPSAGLDAELLRPAGGSTGVAEPTGVAWDGGLRAQAICLYPAQFNAWARMQNKAEINWRLTSRLVRAMQPAAPAVVADGDGGGAGTAWPTVWTLDRQGGRKRYAGLLAELFAPAYVQVVLETNSLCVYRLRGERQNGWVAVKVGGEQWSVGTALASMVAKALREAAMARLNRHFCGQFPGLQPTAGYPTDAERWRSAICGLNPEQEPAWQRVWRCK